MPETEGCSDEQSLILPKSNKMEEYPSGEDRMTRVVHLYLRGISPIERIAALAVEDIDMTKSLLNSGKQLLLGEQPPNLFLRLTTFPRRPRSRHLRFR